MVVVVVVDPDGRCAVAGIKSCSEQVHMLRIPHPASCGIDAVNRRAPRAFPLAVSREPERFSTRKAPPTTTTATSSKANLHVLVAPHGHDHRPVVLGKAHGAQAPRYVNVLPAPQELVVHVRCHCHLHQRKRRLSRTELSSVGDVRAHAQANRGGGGLRRRQAR